MQDIHHLLKQYWGFAAFRPLQEEIIQSALSGKDTLALLPTGGGKSLCFQIPALALDGLCLVVSPLIALMKDQVAALHQKGIKATAIYSGLSAKETDAAWDNCIFGNYKFLYLSPERLLTESFKARAAQMKISLLAVDEAHCISQWGYDFRPPYLQIAKVRQLFPQTPVLALTATATPSVVQDIQEKLLFKTNNVFQKSFVRPNLSYVVRQTIDKEAMLLQIVQKVPGTAIIYVRNRKKTKYFADYLNRHHISADFYHAGLPPKERALKQEAWMNGTKRIICCTNAFGMGIDKPDVRLVVHLDLPDSPEAYFQEAGRAGRDEKKAFAVLLTEQADLLVAAEKIAEKFPPTDFIREVYDRLGAHLHIAYNDLPPKSFDFDLADFAIANKWSALATLHALNLLEQQGLIYLSEGITAPSQLKATAGKETLFAFQQKNKLLEPVIKFVLRTAEGIFDDYATIDEESMAKRLKLTVPAVEAQLQQLQAYHIFSYRPRNTRPQVGFLQCRWKKNELLLQTDFIQARKKEYEMRLQTMVNYASETHLCRTRFLVSYFGEKDAQDCGICDVCIARKKSGLTDREFSKMMQQVEQILRRQSLLPQDLYHQLRCKEQNMNAAIDYLTDMGKIERTEEGNLKWVA